VTLSEYRQRSASRPSSAYKIGDYETCTATKDGVQCVRRIGHDDRHIGHNPATRTSRVWQTPAQPYGDSDT
jgi:hypothetical protein